MSTCRLEKTVNTKTLRITSAITWDLADEATSFSEVPKQYDAQLTADWLFMALVIGSGGDKHQGSGRASCPKAAGDRMEEVLSQGWGLVQQPTTLHDIMLIFLRAAAGILISNLGKHSLISESSSHPSHD